MLVAGHRGGGIHQLRLLRRARAQVDADNSREVWLDRQRPRRHRELQIAKAVLGKPRLEDLGTRPIAASGVGVLGMYPEEILHVDAPVVNVAAAAIVEPIKRRPASPV